MGMSKAGDGDLNEKQIYLVAKLKNTRIMVENPELSLHAFGYSP